MGQWRPYNGVPSGVLKKQYTVTSRGLLRINGLDSFYIIQGLIRTLMDSFKNLYIILG